MKSLFDRKALLWRRTAVLCPAFLFIYCLILTVNCRGGQNSQADTSTEWRNDEANKIAVKELNNAYALIPFSNEYEGTLDHPPFEISWTTGPNLPVTWKGGVAGMVGNDIVLIGGLWMPGYRNLAFAYNLKSNDYREI